MNIVLDEGYLFGLGAFETVAVYDRPVFLDRHLARLAEALEFLGIRSRVTEDEIYTYLEGRNIRTGVLKIVVSGENKLFLPRENHYTREDYERGFVMDFSEVRRNESSPFTYYKTLNYGECILEKRQGAARGLDEMIFLNGRGEICEGAVSNVFFVRKGEIFTPRLSCGLLPGIMRGYVMECCDVEERKILPGSLGEFEECFVTNSLMGIMSVRRLGAYEFMERDTAKCLQEKYRTICGGFLFP
ncbi:aminotransferase class IV [Lachnospiraceae bacterium 46-15]